MRGSENTINLLDTDGMCVMLDGTRIPGNAVCGNVSKVVSKF